jgi:hypothetical protein
MVAATATLWAMFGLVVAGPSLGFSPGVARTAMGLLAAELAALLLASYGCEPECTPAAEAVGTVARVDLPILAAVFVVALLAGQALRRRPSFPRERH